jgi:hypothetical protein
MNLQIKMRFFVILGSQLSVTSDSVVDNSIGKLHPEKGASRLNFVSISYMSTSVYTADGMHLHSPLDR